MNQLSITALPTIEHIPSSIQARILEPDEWQAMLDTLNNMPEETPYQKDDKYRLRFIVAMLFLLGLRIGESTTHHWSAFRQINGNWWFVVRDKGNKLAKIPVNGELLKIIIDYRVYFDMTVYPHQDDYSPLVFSFKNTQNQLATDRLTILLKR